MDRTREIAREFGAKVFEFAWVDDFTAARNAALEHATGDYAFWLDADDVIEPDQREKLIALLEGLTSPPGRIRVGRALPPEARRIGVGQAVLPDPDQVGRIGPSQAGLPDLPGRTG